MLEAVLVPALVASLGFAPVAMSTSIGEEIQRPRLHWLPGSLIRSTPLTLFLLSMLYEWFDKTPQLQEATPLEELVNA